MENSIYRNKQESLDYIEQLSKLELPIYGLEIVKLSKAKPETSMYKTVWFNNQENVYELARTFILEQMIGAWNYAEFK